MDDECADDVGEDVDAVDDGEVEDPVFLFLETSLRRNDIGHRLVRVPSWLFRIICLAETYLPIKYTLPSKFVRIHNNINGWLG